MNQTHCGVPMIGVEYAYGSPNRYDGVSEWLCPKCHYREGRWSGKELKGDEEEPRYGEQPKEQT